MKPNNIKKNNLCLKRETTPTRLSRSVVSMQSIGSFNYLTQSPIDDLIKNENHKAQMFS